MENAVFLMKCSTQQKAHTVIKAQAKLKFTIKHLFPICENHVHTVQSSYTTQYAFAYDILMTIEQIHTKWELVRFMWFDAALGKHLNIEMHTCKCECGYL